MRAFTSQYIKTLAPKSGRYQVQEPGVYEPKNISQKLAIIRQHIPPLDNLSRKDPFYFN